MTNDDFLLKEADRQRRLLRDSGLNQHLKPLRDPSYQQALNNALSTGSHLNEVDKIQRLVQERMTSIQQPLVDSMQNMLANLPNRQIQLEKIQKALTEHIELSAKLTKLNDFATINEKFLKAEALKFDRLTRPIRDVNTMLEVARQVSESTSLLAMQRSQLSNETFFYNYVSSSIRTAFEVNRFIQENVNLSNFSKSFAAELLVKLPYPSYPEGIDVDELEYEEYQKKTAEFLEFFIAWFGDLKPTWMNFITVVGFVMAFVIPAYQEYSNYQMEKRLNEKIGASETKLSNQMLDSEARIVEQVARLKPATPMPTFYVVERTAKLKLGVKTGSPTVAVLPPNQLVELITARGKLIYVEYIDYLEGVPKRGWVLKKYLKLVPPQAQVQR